MNRISKLSTEETTEATRISHACQETSPSPVSGSSRSPSRTSCPKLHFSLGTGLEDAYVMQFVSGNDVSQRAS